MTRYDLIYDLSGCEQCDKPVAVTSVHDDYSTIKSYNQKY
jgi:hypothetical protein